MLINDSLNITYDLNVHPQRQKIFADSLKEKDLIFMIFISHAAKDDSLVDSFFQLLQTGANLSFEDVFISSVPGTDLPTGSDIPDDIRENLNNAELVILFITPNYYASRFCLAELGAAWIQEKDIFPLIAPDLDREIGDNMLGTKTERFNKKGLNKLFDRVKTIYPAKKYDTARWELMRDEFLDLFGDRYSDLPKPATVRREELEEALNKAEVAMELRRETEQEAQKLRDQIRELEDLKNDKDVRKIKKKYSDVYERFDAIIKELRKHLDDLNEVIIRAIYAKYVQKDWVPTEECWRIFGEELERGIDSKYIICDSRERPKFLIADGSHPKVGKILDKLLELREFLSREDVIPLIKELEDEYEFPIELENIQFWEDIILNGSRLPQ